MEYYSAIKRNKIELFVVRWMDLASVIQSELSQKEKNDFFKMYFCKRDSRHETSAALYYTAKS